MIEQPTPFFEDLLSILRLSIAQPSGITQDAICTAILMAGFERPTHMPNIDDDNSSTYLEILLSILMLSSRYPEGITKGDIAGILTAHGKGALYGLAESGEFSEEPADTAS